jgi:flagellar biosynthesis protein
MNDKPPKNSIAVALKYDGLSAPKITAKGKGFIADEIIALARENDIPIQDKPELVQILSKVDIGQEIPEVLYRAVAEVIAFAYMIKGKRPPARGQAAD